jgi:spermidine synthase
VIVSWRDEGGRLTLAFPAVLAGGALLCFTALGPTAVWRHSPIGAGRADASDSSGWRNWMHDQRRNVTWEVEGIESSVGLASEAGYAFIVNGKSDGHFRSDAPTQVMGGLIGAAIHPNPKRAFVIGLGTGSTAGWLAQVPSMERVDVAELEPGILHVATLAAPVNADAMRNPRLRVRLGDAREMLLTTRDRYDIVFSEPSNPYRAGVASLFTRDFYEAVEGRLRPGGIFLQWVQSYEIDAPTVRTVYATLAAVFDHVESWQSHTGDLILLASNAPRRYEATVLRERLKEEPFRAAMHAAWRTESLEGFLSRYLASEKFTNVLLETGSTPVNTDDRNRIEFEAARSVGTESRFDIAELRAAATGIAAHRPAIAGAVDWKRVDQERLVIHSGAGGSPSVAAAGDDEALERRGRAHGAWVKGRLDTALDDWKRCCTQPINSLEIALVAEIASDAAEPPAAAWIDRLAWEDGVEADLIRARLLWRQQRLDDAAAYLVRGYEAHRKDPWPLPFIVSRSFNIAELTATERPDLAPAIHDALSRPFALRSLDYQRRMTAFAIARRLEKSCGPRVLAGIREFEPWVPWTRDFLEIRARCYQEARDPRAAEASRHLDELLAREPKPLLP